MVALAGAVEAGRLALRGQLPDHYHEYWRAPFNERVEPLASRPGARILDLGAGRLPTIPPHERGPECSYVGLDVSAEEMALAETGAYDEAIVGDATVFQPRLREQFDLIISWQVLEHLRPLTLALRHCRSYLRPGGRFVAMFSGRYSPVGVLNRVIPHPVAQQLVAWKTGRREDEVFPAFYDECYYDAIRRMLVGWNEVDIVPIYHTSEYFNFWRATEALCIAYEEWLRLGSRANLATHYLVCASL